MKVLFGLFTLFEFNNLGIIKPSIWTRAAHDLDYSALDDTACNNAKIFAEETWDAVFLNGNPERPSMLESYIEIAVRQQVRWIIILVSQPPQQEIATRNASIVAYLNRPNWTDDAGKWNWDSVTKHLSHLSDRLRG